jgi:hypothetical protein
MKIEIKRTEVRAEAISGTLTINGQYICDTAENRLTALPAGQYRIVRHYCKQYNRFMPLVGHPGHTNRHPEHTNSHPEHTNRHPELVSGSNTCEQCQQLEEEEVSLNTTLPSYCPMLKPGNGIHGRTDGSILLGTLIIPGCLKHPLAAFDPLAERIRKALSRNKEITLTICHPEHPHCHPEHTNRHPELVSGSDNPQQQMLKQVQHDKRQGLHDKRQVQHNNQTPN